MIIIIEKENLRLNEEWEKTPFEGLQYDIIKTGIFKFWNKRNCDLKY